MKNKLLLIIGIPLIIASTLLSLSIAAANIDLDKYDALPTCKNDEVQLDMKISSITDLPTDRKCLAAADYLKVKTKLKTDRATNLKNKGYEFDINDRDLLMGILDYEIKKKGGMSIQGATKEKIKIELLKLLE